MQQAPKPIFATIPDPTQDVGGLYRTVVALKQAVDKMMGTQASAEGPTGPEKKASVFVQDNQPDHGSEGDFWLCKGGFTTSLSVNVNGQWLVIWP